MEVRALSSEASLHGNRLTRDDIAVASISATVAYLYYLLLSAKTWTWVLAGGNSGDWLQFLHWWAVPQPLGSPLFAGYIRLLGWIRDSFALGIGDIPLVTVFVSVIPGAIAVGLTYLIGKKWTGRTDLGIVAATVCMGASFMLQSTIIEQFGMVAMFSAASFLAYLHDRWGWTALLLGLGLATHSSFAPLAIVWLLVEHKQWRRLVKVIPLYAVFGILPYALTLWEMTLETPKMISGYLSWQTLSSYLGGLGGVGAAGSMAATEAPQKALEVGAMLVAAFGLAWIPLAVAARKGWQERNQPVILAVATLVMCLWLWFTHLLPDGQLWMPMAVPIASGLVVVGLSRMEGWHKYVVTAGACALILANSIWLNADRLTRQDPEAETLYQTLQGLPDNAVVVTPRGGSYGFAVMYVMSTGKRLIPVIADEVELIDRGIIDGPPGRDGKPRKMVQDQGYLDSVEWLKKHHPEIVGEGNRTTDIVTTALARGHKIYIVGQIPESPWRQVFHMVGTSGVEEIGWLYE